MRACSGLFGGANSTLNRGYAQVPLLSLLQTNGDSGKAWAGLLISLFASQLAHDLRTLPDWKSVFLDLVFFGGWLMGSPRGNWVTLFRRWFGSWLVHFCPEVRRPDVGLGLGKPLGRGPKGLWQAPKLWSTGNRFFFACPCCCCSLVFVVCLLVLCCLLVCVVWL